MQKTKLQNKEPKICFGRIGAGLLKSLPISSLPPAGAPAGAEHSFDTAERSWKTSLQRRIRDCVTVFSHGKNEKKFFKNVRFYW